MFGRYNLRGERFHGFSRVRGFGTMKGVILLLLSSIILTKLCVAQSLSNLGPLPSPESYGSVFMVGTGSEKKPGPVVFSHITNRVHYTCRVCHYELEFSMKP